MSMELQQMMGQILESLLATQEKIKLTGTRA
jgi:hypothetical protein